MIDCVPAAAFQPEIVPSSVANRKVAGDPSFRVKAPSEAKLLNTCPVGLAVPGAWPGGTAMVTGGMTFVVTPAEVTL